MSHARALLASAATLALVLTACDRQLPSTPGGDAGPPSVDAARVDGSTVGCQATGTGLTAVLVNQDVVGQTIEIGDCDVGAFFDEDGVVRNATFRQPDDDPAPNVQYLVRVDGAEVDVTRSGFQVTDDYVHQIIHVGYRDGATGQIARNSLSGFKRAGILLADGGTSATVKRNDVIGIGENTDGWAENGIQVSGGATGTLVDNRVSDHWWDDNDFVSSGVIVFGADEVTVQRNTLEGNDVSVVLFGDRNKAVHNTVRATAPDGSKDGTLHYGAWISGRNNGLVRNEFTTGTSADVGTYVFGGSVNTKLIGNTYSGGFGTAIFDGGQETKLPAPFEP